MTLASLLILNDVAKKRGVVYIKKFEVTIINFYNKNKTKVIKKLINKLYY